MPGPPGYADDGQETDSGDIVDIKDQVARKALIEQRYPWWNFTYNTDTQRWTAARKDPDVSFSRSVLGWVLDWVERFETGEPEASMPGQAGS